MNQEDGSGNVRLNERLGECELPNGCRLYWEDNKAGGRTYYSDEIGGGVMVWDTCLCEESTLLAALTTEATLEQRERIQRADASGVERRVRRVPIAPIDYKPIRVLKELQAAIGFNDGYVIRLGYKQDAYLYKLLTEAIRIYG
jgi:hypothetical protein